MAHFLDCVVILSVNAYAYLSVFVVLVSGGGEETAKLYNEMINTGKSHANRSRAKRGGDATSACAIKVG